MICKGPSSRVGCLDHERPTSLEGTNCDSSLTYSSTISLHLSVCRLPGTLQYISPYQALCCPSPSTPQPLHPILFIPYFSGWSAT